MLIRVRMFRMVMNFIGMLKGNSVVIILISFKGVVVKMISDSWKFCIWIIISSVISNSMIGIMVVMGV